MVERGWKGDETVEQGGSWRVKKGDGRGWTATFWGGEEEGETVEGGGRWKVKGGRNGRRGEEEKG